LVEPFHQLFFLHFNIYKYLSKKTNRIILFYFHFINVNVFLTKRRQSKLIIIHCFHFSVDIYVLQNTNKNLIYNALILILMNMFSKNQNIYIIVLLLKYILKNNDIHKYYAIIINDKFD